MEKALDIDNSDPTLFFKFAAVAIRAGDLMAARNALEVSFRVTHTVPGQQIRHWPSLDLLISVTYKLEDCLACLRYIEWALKVNIYNHDRIYLLFYLFSVTIVAEFQFISVGSWL